MGSDHLISASDLAEHLSEVTVLDVRYRLGGPPGLPDYQAGHIPGAAYVDLDADLADPPGARGRHPLPDAARFEAAMRRVGVSTGRPVVVYDDWGSLAAARAWWLLRYHGHAHVRVLDGGWSAWLAAGLPTEVGEAETLSGDFTSRPGALPAATADEVGQRASRGEVVDVRAPERYRGEHEPVDPVAGHIPGAVNVPLGLLTEDGVLAAPDTVRELFPEGELVVYCGSGVTAALGVLALATAGREAALYPGSWSEWITDPSRPVATGPHP